MIPAKTYTKEDLAKALAKAPCGLSNEEAGRAVNWFVEILANYLSNSEIGTRLEIRGLGVFKVILSGKKTPHLPHCTKVIPPQKRIKFMPSKVIKKILESS